jgi:hypothetical protein
VTTASTLYIGGAPIAGTNATITNAYALHVAGGNVQLGSSTSVVKTGNNTLDDGTGKMVLLYGSGNPVLNKVLLTLGSGAEYLWVIDAGGNTNIYSQSGGYACRLNDGTNYIGMNGGGNVTTGAKFVQYNNISTVGLGLSPIYAAGLLISLGTSSTAVASYTPTSSTGQSFHVQWRLSASAATTPTLTLSWTDPKAGAQSVTLSSAAMAANTTAQGVFPLTATSAAAISVTGSALVAGDIFATAEIVQDQ